MVNDLKMLLKNAIFGLNRNTSETIGQNKTNRAFFIYWLRGIVSLLGCVGADRETKSSKFKIPLLKGPPLT